MKYLQNQRMREIHARESETFITGIEDNFSRPTHKTGSIVHYGVRNCPGKLKNETTIILPVNKFMNYRS